VYLIFKVNLIFDIIVSIISGKDGTRGYVTGEFNEKGLIDDISGFSLSQIHSVEHWVQFYKKQYSFKGILIHIRTFCVLYDTAFYSFRHQQTATTFSHFFMYCVLLNYL
jgi:hypothetical protein